jgi:hypothetical protein
MTSIHDSIDRATIRTVGVGALAVALVFGLGAPAAHSETTQFQDEQKTSDSDRLDQTASYNGYNEGYTRGASDLKAVADFEPQNSEAFQQATSGYSSEMGQLGQYQSSFRSAYERGYSDGYHGRERTLASMLPPTPSDPRDENRGNWPDIEEAASSGSDVYGAAATNGYNAGYKRGAEAKRWGVRSDYDRNETYQTATEGYGLDMGGRGEYQRVFRQVYARGFSDGYDGRTQISDISQVYSRDEQRDPPPENMSLGDIAQVGIANGYHAGFARGTSNKRSGQAVAYKHDGSYQQATIGYDRAWDLQSYQRDFRQGYERGYEDGYGRRSRNTTYEDTYTHHRAHRYDDHSVRDFDAREDGTIDPQSFTKRAAASGYRDGFERGEYDRRMGVRRPNPKGHGAFQFALDGWDSMWGNRSTYQQYFRQYFLKGHQDGFNRRGAEFVFQP